MTSMQWQVQKYIFNKHKNIHTNALHSNHKPVKILKLQPKHNKTNHTQSTKNTNKRKIC